MLWFSRTDSLIHKDLEGLVASMQAINETLSELSEQLPAVIHHDYPEKRARPRPKQPEISDTNSDLALLVERVRGNGGH